MGWNNKQSINRIFSAGTVLAVSLFSASSLYSATDREQAIIDRIAPVGDVCVEGQDCGGVVAAAPAAAASGPRSAEDIYNKACFGCHGTGAAGAPKFGEAADWAPRIANGMETLIKNGMNGVNAMPPMGTCMDCSDEEFSNTVQYIVDNSQ